MKDANEAAVRLGLALYERTVLDGPLFYNIYELVFDRPAGDEPRPPFQRMFSTEDDFWSDQAETALILDRAGLAQAQRRQVAGSGAADYWLKLTTLGRSVYSIAFLRSETATDAIEGLSIHDVSAVLEAQDSAEQLATEIRALDASLDRLKLSNNQRASVNAYANMLALICDMPERDAKLFWAILERLNQFAGVASLIVALIALKLAR